MPEITTRLFEPGDLPAVYAVEKVCFDERVRFSRSLMRSLVEDPHCRTWVGMADGVVAGFAVVSLREQGREVAAAVAADGGNASGLVGPMTAYLWTIEVLPVFRRIGLVRRLLARTEESAREAGCEALELHVSERNVEAIVLYVSAGYERVGVEPGYYGQGEDGLRLRKILRPICRAAGVEIGCCSHRLM